MGSLDLLSIAKDSITNNTGKRQNSFERISYFLMVMRRLSRHGTQLLMIKQTSVKTRRLSVVSFLRLHLGPFFRIPKYFPLLFIDPDFTRIRLPSC